MQIFKSRKNTIFLEILTHCGLHGFDFFGLNRLSIFSFGTFLLLLGGLFWCFIIACSTRLFIGFSFFRRSLFRIFGFRFLFGFIDILRFLIVLLRRLLLLAFGLYGFINLVFCFSCYFFFFFLRLLIFCFFSWKNQFVYNFYNCKCDKYNYNFELKVMYSVNVFQFFDYGISSP